MAAERITRMPEGLARFGSELPLGNDPAAIRQRVEALERIMERLVRVPGTNRRLGLDVLLDFVPVAGPVAAAVIGSYLVWEARNLGLSKGKMARMFGNVGVDWALGMIPFVGAVPDYFFRSNTRNLRIIHRYLDKHYPATAVVDQPVSGGRARS